MNRAVSIFTGFILFLSLMSGCGQSQSSYEWTHPAQTANTRCLEHDGVESISVDRHGGFVAAVCKDGTAIESE